MWKPEHRRAAERRGLRYPSDLTDAEWGLVEPLIPPAKRGGRKRTVDLREVLNAIFYVLSTGCQWKALPKDLPPKSTAWDYLDLWEWLLWTGLITFSLLLVGALFVFDFFLVLATAVVGVATLVWVRFRRFPPIIAAYERQLARQRYLSRQRASDPEATIRRRGGGRRQRRRR